MYERFTEKAIKVIMLAQEEARRLGCNSVDTEQIFLGLICEGTGNAARTLKSVGVSLKDARTEVEKIIGCGPGSVAIKPFTMDAEQPLEFSPGARAALNLTLFGEEGLARDCIGTEHLLLGLLRERNGLAVDVMENLGIDTGELKQRVLQLIAEQDKPMEPTSGIN